MLGVYRIGMQALQRSRRVSRAGRRTMVFITFGSVKVGK